MPKATRGCVVVGVTGASGAWYARRLLDSLDSSEVRVHLVVSRLGWRLAADELDVKDQTAEALLGRPSNRITLHPHDDLGAPIANGSFGTRGMVVCPCSSHSLGGIAAGLGDNLLLRAATVTLKEARRLVLVPREMPMSQIDLRNALRVSQAGAIICPASPGFYMRPQTVGDLVDFVVGRLLDLLDVPHALNTRWTGAPPGSTTCEGPL